MGFLQVVMLLVQIFPSALKALQAWQDYHGKQIDAERRKMLAADIKKMVEGAIESKDTSTLEASIKNLGKPVSVAANPNSQNPS